MRRIIATLLVCFGVLALPFANPHFQVWRGERGYVVYHEWPSPNDIDRLGLYDGSWADGNTLLEVYEAAAKAAVKDLRRAIVPDAHALSSGQRAALFGKRTTPTIVMDFTTGIYTGLCGSATACLSVTRASNATDLQSTSASGYQFNTYSSNVLTISTAVGLLQFESRTNQLLNSCSGTTYSTQCAGNTGPATQTTGTLAATAQTLWVNGSGSAALSNGTATGCTGTASQGTPVTFTPTAGTCTVTVTGSLNFFQLEAGAFPTSGIITTGAAATRATDNIVTAGALVNAVDATPFSIIVSLGGSPNATPRIIDDNTDTQTQMFTGSTAFRSAPSVGQIVATIGGGLTSASAFKAAVAYDSTGGAVVAGTGGTAVTGSNAWTSTNNPSRIGASSAGGANSYNGSIRKITTYNIRLSNAALTAQVQ